MSNNYYEGLLSEVLVELRDLMVIGETQVLSKSNLPKNPVEQQHVFNQHYQSLYVKYVNLYNKLEECYDQLLQPQKREDLKAILEHVMGRTLEVKAIVNTLLGEYSEFDDVLIDLKLDPTAIELKTPRFIIEENEKEIRRREILLDVLRKRPNSGGDIYNVKSEPVASAEIKKAQPVLTINQAILIIQTNERARQGRRLARNKHDQKISEERKQNQKKEESESSIIDEAAIKIQKVFRGYYWRKRVSIEKQEEARFIGMSTETPRKQKKKIEHDGNEHSPPELEETREAKIMKAELLGRTKRKIKQDDNKRELEEQRVRLRGKILEEEGPHMMEEMHDALMEQILLFRQEGDGGVPTFPSESEGGSKAFMQNIIKATEEQKKLLQEQKKQAMQPKQNAKNSKAPPTKPKAPTKGKEGPIEEEPKFKDESKFIANISTLLKQFVEKWRDRYSSLDFDQKYDPLLLRKELMEGDNGIEEEIRKKVDEQIREELENIRMQLESENPPKKDARQKPDPKRENETVKLPNSEAFFSELASLGIINKVPPKKLDSYIGENRLIGSILEWEEPSIFQVRNFCKELVLYMSTPNVHKSAPLLRSIMFYGHKGTGKTSLVNMISHELGALFFDLSPAITQNINTEQSETNTMIAKVFRVAKEMQPAIIYIDDFDTVIKGKGKGKNKPNMKRLRKPLLTQMKAIAPEDRILVIGTMDEPWDADSALFDECFDKMVYTTLPDYSSYRMIWKAFIEERIGRPLWEDFDLHTLAHIATNYTVSNIKLICDTIINERRLKKIDERPLDLEEFIAPMSKIDPIYKQDDLKMKQFTQKLPLKFRKKSKEDKEKEKQEMEAKLAESKPTNNRRK